MPQSSCFEVLPFYEQHVKHIFLFFPFGMTHFILIYHAMIKIQFVITWSKSNFPWYNQFFFLLLHDQDPCCHDMTKIYVGMTWPRSIRWVRSMLTWQDQGPWSMLPWHDQDLWCYDMTKIYKMSKVHVAMTGPRTKVYVAMTCPISMLPWYDQDPWWHDLTNGYVTMK